MIQKKVDKMKKKILLYGIGTFKNRGVEAIINSTLKMIDRKKFDVTLATYDYEYNKDMYTKIPKVKHYYKSDELTTEEQEQEAAYKKLPFDYHNFEKLYQKDVISEIDKSDICISVGGDNYCYPFCNWAYTLDEYANLKNKKTVLWGASLFDEITDDDLINDLNNFDVLVIRESLSYRALKKYIPENRIIYAPDPAFSLEPKEVKLNHWYKKRNIVALNVSPLTIQNKDQERAVYSLIEYILKETKYSVLLLPHVTTEDCNDLDVLQKIKDKYEGEERVYLENGIYNCQELKYIISQCKILVAARTHASIAAYSTGIPTLVIGYSVKSRGLAKDLFGTFENYVISKDNVIGDNLVKHFQYIDNNQTKIQGVLKEKIPKLRETSSNLFNLVLEKLKEQEEEQICKRDTCIGCGVCVKKCPHDAIMMIEDEQGFKYPKIDLEKCTHCNICRKSCPINKNQKVKEIVEKEVYAAINLNEEEQKKSTSGGIFSVLAKAILNKNGVVYGSYLENKKAKHIRITEEQELDKIRGSKYIQSEILDIFDQLKKDLDNKVKVLFCGTPCQIGAVRAFLGKEYDNLVLVSLICHGVMSQNIFEKYISEIEQEKDTKVKKFKFRTKNNKWTQASIEYETDKNVRVEKFVDNPLMKLYLKNYILRETCYSCKFRDFSNLGDIILGDFWGIEVIDPEMLDEKGVSALIINSKKGKVFLDNYDVFQKIKVKSEVLEETIKYNPVLITSVKKPADRRKALNDLKENSIKLVSKYYCDYAELKEKYFPQETRIAELEQQNKKLVDELTAIINSKRWQIIDKGINKINKILRRNKR